MPSRSKARRNLDRIHLEPEDLIHLPTLPDDLIARINSRRDFVGEELADVDRQLYEVVRALREASCDKFSRAVNRTTHEAADASDDDGEIRETGFG